MKTELEKINDVERLLKVTFEWNEVQGDYEQLVMNLRKNFKLDGFRPGKVPVSIAKKHLAARIQYEFINTMIEKTFDEAVKDTGILDYIGSSLEDVSFEENKPLTYDIKIEVDPEIVLPDYKKGLSVQKKEYIIEERDIQQYIDAVIKERAEIEKVSGTIESGYFVTVDLVNDQGSRQEDIKWEVGTTPLDGDVEKAFIGKKAGDEFKVVLTIKNKSSENTVFIKNVEKHLYPEINDEWVKTNLETVDTLEAWKKQIYDSIAKEMGDRAKYEFEQNIKNWFRDNIKVTLPKARIENYLENMVTQFNYQRGGKSNINPADIKHFYRPQAEESVRWFLIEEKIKEDEGLDVTSEDFEAKIDEMLALYPEDQKDSFRNIYKQENYRKQLELQILSEKIFAHINEFVKVEIEKVKLSDLTQN
ncbi:MAG: trigger factor [Candidatus Marinimicrobia bacterium]|nr:trigger factor [Candidatus Neomarinimicrobiota bacterium]